MFIVEFADIDMIRYEEKLKIGSCENVNYMNLSLTLYMASSSFSQEFVRPNCVFSSLHYTQTLLYICTNVLTEYLQYL